MNRVNNKKAINNLALSGIKVNIKKYLVLIASVILTTLLFSSLFTVGGSMLKEIQLSTMRLIIRDLNIFVSQSMTSSRMIRRLRIYPIEL